MSRRLVILFVCGIVGYVVSTGRGSNVGRPAAAQELAGSLAQTGTDSTTVGESLPPVCAMIDVRCHSLITLEHAAGGDARSGSNLARSYGDTVCERLRPILVIEQDVVLHR